MTLHHGLNVSGYVLTAQLGEGGTGVVWSARSQEGTAVAMKFLRADGDLKMRLRLTREAQILSRLRSPFIARLLGHGVDALAGPFLVSELVQGETLDQRLRRGAVDNAQLARIIDQTLQGLHDAHEAGVIHRDIKPSNLMLTEDEQGERAVKMVDFGVSKVVFDKEGDALTSLDATLGTVVFMAPEQVLSSRDVTPQADLYALGAVLFYALTGRLPHRGRAPVVVMTLKVECDAPRLCEARPAAWPAPLEEFVARLLARDLTVRFRSARAARDAWVEAARALQDMAPMSSPFDCSNAPPPTEGR